jgi:uncharacterized protein (DUF2236 family)
LAAEVDKIMNVSSKAIESVSTEGLERELMVLRATATSPLAGIFGPRSVTWHVNRESALFLGAGRALLLQLAHPWIGAAVAQHSHAVADPVGRFHRTFGVVFTMVFGTLDQSLAAARRLHRRHVGIKGRLPAAAGPFAAGELYCANALPALRWVYATLIDTALIAHALVLRPLGGEQRERYYAESRLFAALFGIPSRCLPADWSGFRAYCEAMAESDTLTVTNEARAIAQRLLAGGDSWLPIPGAYRVLTAALLPGHLRDAFGLSYGRAEQRAVDDFLSRARRLYPLLPYRLRYVGPYQEAEQRLAGRTRPDLLTQLCNRLWIGRPELAAP